MNTEYDRMSPNQRDNARKSLEEILALADQVPARPKPRVVEDMLPLVRKLRDEKQLSWTDIANWINANTEFNRSNSFWSSLYKGVKKEMKTQITLIDDKGKPITL